MNTTKVFIRYTLLMLFSLVMLKNATASNIDTTYKYAWIESTGWLNFNPTHESVTVYSDHLEGYAWSSNIGWIQLGSYNGGAAHTYDNTGHTDWGINHDDLGNLSGYAWSETIGWINFNPSHHQVTIDPVTGDFDGYAYSGTVGWILFQSANPVYKVSYVVSIPLAPTDLVASAHSSNQINLNWTDNSDNETGFAIERDGHLILTTTAEVTNYNDTGLICGVNYTYLIRAVNGAGESAVVQASASTFACPTSPPVAPTNLEATAASPIQIDLSWNDLSDNENGFVIERDGLLIHTTAANESGYSDTGLSCGTTYTYLVRATNVSGDSAPVEKMVQTKPCLPAAPTDLKATTASATEIKLTWIDKSQNESGFVIKDDRGMTYTTEADVTRYSLTGLTCETLYKYSVNAINASGESVAIEASATTFACPTFPPILPKYFEPASVSPTEIQLTWNDSSDNESGFLIERDGVLIHTTAADETTYLDSGLTCGTTYTYSIKASNPAGDSDSIVKKIETSPCPPITPVLVAPTELSAIATSTTEIQLTWTDNNANESGFILKRDEVSIHTTAANETSYLDSGLTCGVTYSYSVTATNATEESEATTTSTNTPACPIITPSNQQPTNIELSNNRIDEDSPGGMHIGTFSTQDPDPNDTHTYQLLTDLWGVFELRENHLLLHPSTQLDFEKRPYYTIVMRSTDAGGLFIDNNFTIFVNNIAETRFTGKFITKTGKIGNEVKIDAPEYIEFTGYIEPTRKDIGQPADIFLTYNWTPANSGKPLEVLIPIAKQEPLKKEMEYNLYQGRVIGLSGTFKVHLGYQLKNGKKRSASVATLTVQPNHAPLEINLSAHTVAENSPANTLIGTFTTVDTDNQDGFVYGLVKNPGNYFKIVDNQLLTNSSRLDYETGNRHQITVRSVDSSGSSVEEKFVIRVTDVESVPTGIYLTQNEISENSPSGIIVGRLVTESPEPDHYIYELLDDAQGHFQLIEDTLVVANGARLDFETQSEHLISVRSKATQTNRSIETNFIVNVLNKIDVGVIGEMRDPRSRLIPFPRVQSTEPVTIKVQLIPEAEHRGQEAEFFSVATYTQNELEIMYMWDGESWTEWDGNLTTLCTLEPVILLDSHKLTIWEGQLTEFAEGELKVFMGYRLTNGELVYSPESINLSVY